MSTFRPNSVKLVQKVGNCDTYNMLCVLTYKDGDSLSDFRAKISGVLKFKFDFWDDRLPGRILESAEQLLPLEELGGTVVVIEKENVVLHIGVEESVPSDTNESGDNCFC